jgi:hypothetical protein
MLQVQSKNCVGRGSKVQTMKRASDFLGAVVEMGRPEDRERRGSRLGSLANILVGIGSVGGSRAQARRSDDTNKGKHDLSGPPSRYLFDPSSTMASTNENPQKSALNIVMVCGLALWLRGSLSQMALITFATGRGR